MVLSREDQQQTSAPLEEIGEWGGCYAYCVAPAGGPLSLGPIGIDGGEVYAVVRNNLCAFVHNCLPLPYQSGDAGVVAAWVLAHHRVVEEARGRCGTVLPMTFNTIVQGEEKVKSWLETEHMTLRTRLDSLHGKAEYGVQVFWDCAVAAREATLGNPQVQKLEEEIRSKPRGLAYMYRQKLAAMLKKGIEAKAEEMFKDLYGRISRCVDKTHVEKPKQVEEGRQMLLNMSCLVSTERSSDLRAEMDKVSRMEDYSVRLVGPLPPYSFC